VGAGVPYVVNRPRVLAGPVIRDECQAAPIETVTAFAECLVKTNASCPYRFTFNAFLYCGHPERETTIARTLACEGPPGK